MKWLLAVMFAWMVLLVPNHHAWAQKKAKAPVWPLTFEGVTPGDPPIGWSRAWGDQGDDLFLISNERAANGVNSLLLDRKSGTNEAMWGLATKMPQIRSGWAVLSFCMLAQGAGADIFFGIDLRDAKSNRANTVTLGVSKMKIKLDTPAIQKPPAVAELRIDGWQRITVWLPTVEGRQTQVWAKVENLVNGEWKPTGEPISVDMPVLSDPLETFMISTWPKKRDYKVFLDDFRMESGTSAPK